MTDNTIQALRILQLGIEAVRATRVLTMDTQPTANDTITLNGIVYTWVASGATSGQINRGADLAAAKVNLVAAINGVDSIQAGANPFMSAAAFISHAMTVTSRIPGPIGNGYTLAETFTAVSNVWAGSTMTGGAMARGTPVDATERPAVETLAFDPGDENNYHPAVQNGILQRYTGPGIATHHGTRFSIPSQAAIWEFLPFILSGLLGAPVVTGALGGPYTLVWTLDPEADSNPFSYTLQRRFSNGLGGTIDERAAYAMFTELGLAYADGEELKLDGAAGFARAFGTNAITSGLSLPDFEVGVSGLSTIYFNTLFADAGDTLLAEQVIGWSWKLLSGIYARNTAEGRADKSFTKHGTNGSERGIDMSIQCLLDPTTYAAEVTRASDPDTNRFAVRVKLEGTSGRVLTIDQMMQHANALPPISDDQGADVVTFDLLDCTDGNDSLVITMVTPVLPQL